MILRLLYFLRSLHNKSWIGVSLWSLTSRLRGDDKPFIIVTPAHAGVQN
jgi:hypothetical protein